MQSQGEPVIEATVTFKLEIPLANVRQILATYNSEMDFTDGVTAVKIEDFEQGAYPYGDNEPYDLPHFNAAAFARFVVEAVHEHALLPNTQLFHLTSSANATRSTKEL